MTEDQLLELEQAVDDLLTKSGATNAESMAVLDILLFTFKDRVREDELPEDEG